MTPEDPGPDGSERHHQVKALFLRALDLPRSRRAAFLAEACAGDPALQREVLELFLLHGEQDSVLDTPPDPTEALAGLPSSEDDRAGRWRLLRELGRGGMGVVHLAEDAEGHLAAVKFLAPGITTPETRERFRQEAAILSRLDHPGVARILDHGERVPPSGGSQPWIAMEYVDGRPLLEDAEARGLGMRARLERLLAVCEAVQHAHSQGVVHRDLKPSNILVRADGQPVVLDFGVARLLGGDERPAELATRTGQLIGTPQYMSPEQVSGDSSLIAPASDVYSLGVIAYELLSGQLPYEASSVSLHRAVVSILTLEPRPLREVAPDAGLALERIVAMALEKQPADRYPDASALAADLRRQLDGRTVRARGPSLGRRIARWSRRRKRVAVALGSLLFLTLVGVAWTIGKSWTITPEEVKARYREAESLTYSMVPLLYEGERTPERLRAAIDAGERARNLIEGIPRLRHYPLLIRHLGKELGTARYLLGEMTWEIGELRQAMAELTDAIGAPADPSPGWQEDLQTKQIDLSTSQRDLLGLRGGATSAAHRLWGEWATSTGPLDDALTSRALLQAERGAPPPAESLQTHTAHNDPWAFVYNSLAQAHIDHARYGGNPRCARLGLAYSDSAYARVAAFLSNWPAYGSLLYERARAFRTVAELCGVPADLDSAGRYLIACEEFRRPARARVCAETRTERAALRLTEARTLPDARLRRRALRAARADADSAMLLLRSVNAPAPAIAELQSFLIDVFIEQALVERDPAPLDSAARYVELTDGIFQPSSLPRASGLLLTRLAHLAAARTTLLGEPPAPALALVERAEQFARSPRNDSLITQRAAAVRLELQRAGRR